MGSKDPVRNFVIGCLVFAFIAQLGIVVTFYVASTYYFSPTSWSTANSLADPLGMLVQLALVLAVIIAVGNVRYGPILAAAAFCAYFGFAFGDYRPTHEWLVGWAGLAGTALALLAANILSIWNRMQGSTYVLERQRSDDS